jgi:hypothetical protein
MSVHLKPCTGCPLRNGCEQRDEFRRRVAGLGLRSATFNCDRLKTAMAPGTRIIVSHPVKVEMGGSYYEGPQFDVIRKDLPATITGSGRDEFSCVIDRDALLAAIAAEEGEDADKVDTYRFRKTMKARRIVRFLDEPPRPLCITCGNVRLPDGRCDTRGDVKCDSAQTSNFSLEAV